jgi:mono/diheme cytochrome c family protein
MLGLFAFVGCKSEAATVARTDGDTVARGKLLTLVSGCNDCHTPLKMGANGPEPDWSRELSGHPAEMPLPPPPAPQGPWLVSVAATNTAWSGPWGVTFTANLSPDNETGTGTWTRQNFIDTIQTGRHMGAGRPLLPPMPAAMYANYSDADLGAIYDYLRTIKPIKNKVPSPLPPAAPKESK